MVHGSFSLRLLLYLDTDRITNIPLRIYFCFSLDFLSSEVIVPASGSVVHLPLILIGHH